VEYLNKLTEQAQGDAGLQRDLAEAYLKVGDVQGNPYGANLGDPRGAVQSYRKALEISQALARTDPIDAIAGECLAKSYESLGQVLPLLGKPTEAVADLQKATSLLESLAAAQPADKELRFRLANSYQVLGDLQGHSGIPNLGDTASSLSNYQKSLALYQSLLSSDGTDVRARRGAAVVEIRMGDSHMRDEPNVALESYQRARATFEDLTAADPNNVEDRRRLALAFQKIGGLDETLGNNKDALQNYRKASASSEALWRADPNNAQAGMNLVISLRDAGDLLYKMKEQTAAISDYRKALDILQQLSDSEPDNVLAKGRYAEMLIVLGGVLAESGNLPEARSRTARGLTITRQLAARDDSTADELFDYAENFLSCQPADLRQPAMAVEAAKKAAEKSGGGSEYLDQLARAYCEAG